MVLINLSTLLLALGHSGVILY